MTRRLDPSYSKPDRRGTTVVIRRPFWLPASNYYVLAAAVSIGFFFIVWGVLNDTGEDTPWITAGVGASIILGGAVILRVALLRRARDRYERIEPVLAQRHPGTHLRERRKKLTLEQNAAILGEIKKKSSAANILGKLSSGHREVFELCREYIERTESELANVGAASPRFSALLKGRRTASDIHRHHMLQWAEIEAMALTGEASNQVNVEDKLKAAKDALGIIEFALASYPGEQSLVESGALLREMAISIQVSDLIEKAERAAFKGDHREAVGLYRDALFYLGRDNVYTDERQHAADRINAEIERLRLLEGKR